MHGWLLHHLDTVAALVVVGAGLTLSYAANRAWPLLVPVPALFATLAWYAWEFSAEAAPLAVAIAVFGYLGLGLGAGFSRRRRRSTES